MTFSKLCALIVTFIFIFILFSICEETEGFINIRIISVSALFIIEFIALINLWR